MLRGLLVTAPLLAVAALTIPPAPARYFNDYAALVSAPDAQRLDDRLRALDQSSTNQIVVAIFPELPSPSLEDFTVRTAQAWRVGQKKLDSGAVLFVFVKDHKSRLEVGYGLEDKIPDVVAKRILQDVMSPAFKQGRYADGLDAAITAIAAAIGAPAGAQVPVAARPRPDPFGSLFPFPGLPMLIVLVVLLVRARRNRGGWGGGGGGGGWSSGGWSSGGSDWSSGSSGSSGGSDFSGGGGSFGGGGASGDW